MFCQWFFERDAYAFFRYLSLNPYQMKPYLLPLLCKLLIMLCFVTVQAQTRPPVIYDNLPEYGIDLNTGWHYAPNDNAAFAKPDFDDNGWAAIEPTKEMSGLPQLKAVKIGWLRLRFKTGPKLGSRSFIFTIFQSAASEVYLDGKLLGRYGTLSNRPSEVVPLGANMPEREIYISQDGEHVLAVRFAPWQGTPLFKNRANLCWITLHDASRYVQMFREAFTSGYTYVVLTAVFFLLSLLHLSFYRYDRRQRANLYFAIYTIFSTIGFFGVVLQGEVQDIRAWNWVYAPTFLITLMGSVWIIKALGSLFGFPIRKLLIVLWCLYSIAAVYILLEDINYPFFGGLLAFGLVQLWLTARALKEKKRGAGIIAVGFTFSVLAAVPMLLMIAGNLNGGIFIFVYQGLMLVIFLAPAVGISLYLAREFAMDSSLLREKLVQVETLSHQSLVYEQEKQQILSSQNDELEKQVMQRTNELQQSLNHLRSAQEQLIQTEKMASLGELTAGIAHEIQNPLNFVNNFSEVNCEMIDEMKVELTVGNLAEALAIADDIRQNSEKISHHGKRADDIVKGMLEHSRTSTGQKTITDVNKLSDEYLRLAYHGLRAKDKTFNAELITHFDPDLPPVNIKPQDIGRVLLNLFNNAFYAMQQQQKITLEDYKPIIVITTLVSGNNIVIKIKDNGVGIPAAIQDKIMQPFFTTKPAGQGTGLGLSLSYDIVVKGHGGRVEVENDAGEGAVFVIFLPVNN